MKKEKSIFGKIVTILLIVTMIMCVMFISSCGDNDEETSSNTKPETSTSSNSTETDNGGDKPDQTKATAGLEYSLKDDDTYEVIGIGTAKDSDIVIPQTYKNKAVTSIGEDAFCECESITSITIPNGITAIEPNAFYDCINLKSVTISNSVTSINLAFGYCISLESIVVESGNEVYKSSGNCVIEIESKTLVLGCKNSVIPDDGSVTSIGDGAFYECESLTSINIPNSVTTIESYAFFGCSLNSITIPNGVTTIGAYAFAGCNITSLVIPDSVTSISGYAFAWCDNLKSVTIPSSVTYMGTEVFDDCDSLQYNEYHNAYYLGNDENPYYVLVKAKSKSIPSCNINENTGVIASFAFMECSALTNITIPNSVKNIGVMAFAFCEKLTSIKFESTEEWKRSDGIWFDLSDEATAAEYFTNDGYYYWERG